MNHSQLTVDVDLGTQKGPESHGSNHTHAASIDFHQLDALIPTVSARILKASSETLDEVIQNSLQEILQLLGLGRGALLHVSKEHCHVVLSYAWHDQGVEMVSREVNLAELAPWTYQQLVIHGRTVAKYSVDSMPAEAEADRRLFIQLGVKSALAIPLSIDQRVHHIIVVHSLKEECFWPEPFIASLRLLGEIFVSALERRDILKSLEISQARLDVAAASAGAGLWEIDLVTGNIWTTNSARELFDFTHEEPITYSSLLERIHPEDRSLVTEAVGRAQSLGLESQVEYRVPQPDGAMRWLISRGRVRHNGAGAAKMLAGVTVEITERKQMEQKLREQVREINHLRELLEQENTLLRSEAGLSAERHRSLGSSAAMQGIKVLIELVAKTGSTVLIQGETGTGKELVAQAIHQLSDRNKRLMITVNCAALPSALIESELFGREKGAFTGALSRQAGRFELAHGSTLLLDEIAEMPLETQAKLLRVLQTGTFERLGSPLSIKVDVRVIAATNRNLIEEVEQGRFRRDLFYRLNVFPIQVPPLRDRVEDIPMLVWKFVSEFDQKMGRKITRITSRDMDMLMAYSWPGNVRELRNVVERAMITSQGNALDVSQLDLAPARPQPPSIMTLEEVERQHIQQTLVATHGKIKGKGGAAELLGLNPSTLYSRMRKLDIIYTPTAPRVDISPSNG
ncbi:sigma 54-interacting transcriptional regulator [uncultured Desulfobulbus sp.]|uniref:sigma 54-interacting transcriptional regulator n=1 Tax=uncultured Desulfobulbus sp. TaxID=239745 RepID=UPI00374CFD4B